MTVAQKVLVSFFEFQLGGSVQSSVSEAVTADKQSIYVEGPLCNLKNNSKKIAFLLSMKRCNILENQF